MTHQPVFSQAEFAAKKKTTRREKFLARMEEIILWVRLLHDLCQGRFTALNADLTARGLLLREGTGVERRAEIVALSRPMDWPIARKRGQLKTLAEGAEKETLKAVEQVKAAVRAFVEHPFHILKNIFRHRKV